MLRFQVVIKISSVGVIILRQESGPGLKLGDLMVHVGIEIVQGLNSLQVAS